MISCLDNMKFTVVPHEGTWIEIVLQHSLHPETIVVPHEGTWIEILFPALPAPAVSSFPTRERGLKSLCKCVCMLLLRSFPTRERGLKYRNRTYPCRLNPVVPHEGTWIEIFPVFRSRMPVICRSPRGNVD